jgi:hypothetical protein
LTSKQVAITYQQVQKYTVTRTVIDDAPLKNARVFGRFAATANENQWKCPLKSTAKFGAFYRAPKFSPRFMLKTTEAGQ